MGGGVWGVMMMKAVHRKIIAFLGFVILFYAPLVSSAELAQYYWGYNVGDTVLTAVISPDGNYVGIGTSQGYVFLFNKAGEVILKYKTEDQADDVAMTPSGDLVVYDNADYIYYFKGSQLYWRYSPKEGGAGSSIDISSDGRYIVVGSTSDWVYLLDTSGNLLCKYDTGPGLLTDWDVYVVRISNNGNFIAAGNAHGVYFLSKTCTLLWTEELGKVQYLDMPDDGSYVVAAVGNTVYKFTKLGSLDWEITTSGDVTALRVSSDGKYIGIGDSTGKVYLFTKEGAKLWEYNTGSKVTTIDLSSGESNVLVGSSNGVAILLSNRRDALWRASFSNAVNSVAITPNSQYFAIGAGYSVYYYELRGILEVYTTPSDAEVYVNGDFIGKTPLTDYAISAGTYQVSIRKEDYQEIKEVVAISPGKLTTLNRELKLLPAILTITTTPSGANVYLNGNPIGITPIQNKEVEPGTYTLKIEKSGYQIIQEIITLSPGKSTTINKELIPLPVSVTINSNPTGAIVYVNGEQKGMTPLTLSLLPGTYSIKLIKNGYQEYNTQITVKVGQPVTINPTLSKISVSSSPSSSTITRSSAPSTQKSVSSSFAVGPSNSNQAIVTGVKNEKMILAGLGIIALVGLLAVVSKKKRKSQKDKKIVTEAKELFPSQLLKKYEPLEFLGEGGFAKVFKAKRKSDGKIVAVKIPRIDESTSKVFLREVGTWLHLDHPNIVKLYEADILPVPHLEMEFVEGVDLNGKTIRSLEEYPKPTEEGLALKFTKGITQAVKYAHSQNVLHRDIKPLNILLKHDLTPKLTDWGLSKIGVTTSSKTAAGYTPLYAAPEQLLPSQYGHTDYRTDLYQIGAVLYELLTGRPPYEGHSPAELIGKITDPDYIPKKPSEFNPELYIFDSFFEKALAKRKEDRFQSADQMLQALEELERLVKKRKELKETVKELRKTLNRSQLELKKSKSTEEAKLKTLEILDLYQKLAALYCELNSKSELLEILEGLKYYTRKDDLKRDLEKAEEYLRSYIEENLPIGEEFAQKLNELISLIKAEVRGEIP
jgi:serine/threonine protein kinase/WD40 repeat protein